MKKFRPFNSFPLVCTSIQEMVQNFDVCRSKRVLPYLKVLLNCGEFEKKNGQDEKIAPFQ